MAGEGEAGPNELRKVAYCTAIFAGFAYVGYTTLKNAFCRKVFPNQPEQDQNPYGDKSNRACQTDLTLPCGVNINKVAEDLVVTPCKSVKERVRELNIRARLFSDSSPSYTPTSQLSCKSLQNSPWSSPRILSPIDSNDNGLSKSAENINCFSTPPNSPNIRRKSLLKSPPDNVSSRVSSTTSLNSICIDFPQPREPDESLKKSLASLYKRARTMTPIEARNLVALLGSRNEDIVVRTLTTISNCAAFSVNQDLLCDAGCLPVLKDFLDCPTLAIQVAATQAIANLSANERNQGLLQCCICRLTERATSKQCSELLRVSSLTALANLALFNANHMPMKGGITGFLQLIETGTNTTRLQSLKLLVNLSCNSSMLPYLLASKASSQLYKYLSLKGDHDVTLRLITFIANVVITAARQNFKARDLPGDQKAPYPETLYAILFGHSGKELLRKKMANLVQSSDEDIVIQVKRIQAAMNLK